jgi:acetyl esterase/lipase
MDFLDRLDPELVPFLENVPAQDLSGDLPKLRAAMERANAPLRAQLPEVPGVVATDHVVAGDVDVPVRVYERADPEPGAGATVPAMLWIHGGGMIFGSVEGDDFMCRTWVARIGGVLASVEYRLAPEHPYPAHVDDCYAALTWLFANAADLGVDPARISIGGASAGGGIAAGTALLARDRGEVALANQILIFPMIDDRDATPSTHEITFPKVWNRESNRHGWRAYLGDRVGTDDVPLYAAPARATVDDLRGLPPTYMDVGELDPFRDEDIAYATRLLQAGVPCELHVTPGVYHASEGQVLGAASSKRIRGYRTEALRRILT